MIILVMLCQEHIEWKGVKRSKVITPKRAVIKSKDGMRVSENVN